MFNKVILVGNLTRNIELRYTQNGSAIGNSGLAVSRKFNSNNGEKREETCFIDIAFFNRTAEVANQYLSKGSKVLIEGRLKLDQWQDQNGNNRVKHSIIVESMEMLSNNQNQGGSREQNSNFQNNSYQNSNSQNNNYQNKFAKTVEEEKIPEIDINEDYPSQNRSKSKVAEILDDEEIPF